LFFEERFLAMALLNHLTTGAWASVTASLALLAIWMGERVLREQALRKMERLQREELEAYAQLDPALTLRESPHTLASRVCAMVAEHSVFPQVAMLLRDSESRLHVVGSEGVDNLMALDVNGWVARFAFERRRWTPRSERHKSCPTTLGRTKVNPAAVSSDAPGCQQVVVLPLWSHDGEMLGALAVWPATGEDEVYDERLWPLTPDSMLPQTVLAPLETLAQKLGRSIDFSLMSERASRAEKMAGLGELTSGVAHEFYKPLNAVMEHAESRQGATEADEVAVAA
jgi:hypothetical protein